MEQPDLFAVPEVLSPRLRWLQRNNVLLYLSMPDDPALRKWYAAFDAGEWPGHHSAPEYFAREIAANGARRIGTGETEDDAILDLCAKRMVTHWTIEESQFRIGDHGPRFALWQHLHNEHKLTLLDSELDEIIAKACACRPVPAR